MDPKKLGNNCMVNTLGKLLIGLIGFAIDAQRDLTIQVDSLKASC
jgi:preprotein translocase subunit Sss1